MSEYPFSYDLVLCLARPGGALTEDERTAFQNGVEEFNRRSVFMANAKSLELLGFSDDNRIRIRLHSTNPLPTPGRGLRTLTTVLLNSSDRFRQRVTRGGQLFRILEAEARGPQPNGSAVDPASVSDADLVKALVDYLAAEKRSGAGWQEKRAAIQEMKKLAAEAGFFVDGKEDKV